MITKFCITGEFVVYNHPYGLDGVTFKQTNQAMELAGRCNMHHNTNRKVLYYIHVRYISLDKRFISPVEYKILYPIPIEYKIRTCGKEK